jgi:hypothetical protein
MIDSDRGPVSGFEELGFQEEQDPGEGQQAKSFEGFASEWILAGNPAGNQQREVHDGTDGSGDQYKLNEYVGGITLEKTDHGGTNNKGKQRPQRSAQPMDEREWFHHSFHHHVPHNGEPDDEDDQK